MKRIVLFVVAVVVVAAAALGIASFLTRRPPEMLIDALLSALAVAGTGILVLACLTAMERGAPRTIAAAAIVAAAAGGAMLVVGIQASPAGRDFWRVVNSLGAIAVLGTHASLVFAHRLSPRYMWAPILTLVCSALLAQGWLASIWGDGRSLPLDGEIYGVLAIVAICGTILVPILKRMALASGSPPARPGLPPDCPHCGRPLPLSLRAAFPEDDEPEATGA